MGVGVGVVVGVGVGDGGCGCRYRCGCSRWWVWVMEIGDVVIRIVFGFKVKALCHYLNHMYHVVVCSSV